MPSWAGLVCAAMLVIALPADAQELEPQRWRYLPVDTNFVTASYIRNDANIALDPVLGIEDATMSLDTWAVSYLRTFELLGKSAQIRIVQPWQDGSWSGMVNDSPVATRRRGLADTELRLAVHLLGAPPLEGKAYAAYRASRPIETVAGIALSVQVPTGEYMDDKLINLGTNQFTFRPEIGIVHDRGRWSFEASGMVSFYTDNNSYFNGNKLEVDPLYFVQGNILYRFQPNLWVAAGAGYTIGAESTVNGVENDDRRENILLGAAVGYSVVPWLGVTLKYIRSDSQREIGTDSNRYIVSLSTFW